MKRLLKNILSNIGYGLLKFYWCMVPKRYLIQEEKFHRTMIDLTDPLVESEQSKESIKILSKYIEPEMIRRGYD